MNNSLAFHHVALNVENLDTSIRFYQELLGFSVSHRFESSNRMTTIQYLKRDNVYLEMTSRDRKIAPFTERKEEARIKHIAFHVDDCGTFRNTLLEHGYQASSLKEKEIPGAIVTYFFVTDPDGIEIEFIHFDYEHE